MISAELMPLPFPGKWQDEQPPIKPLTEQQKKIYENSLDGVSVVAIPRPATKEEEDKFVESFLNGLRKLLSKEDNWAFWQQLMLTLDSCVKCQTCNEACPIYLSSGKQDIYFARKCCVRLRRNILIRGASSSPS
ncbi:hypothetical protein ACFLT0_01685 [Chloroflexota bacterium]